MACKTVATDSAMSQSATGTLRQNPSKMSRFDEELSKDSTVVDLDMGATLAHETSIDKARDSDAVSRQSIGDIDDLALEGQMSQSERREANEKALNDQREQLERLEAEAFADFNETSSQSRPVPHRAPRRRRDCRDR